MQEAVNAAKSIVGVKAVAKDIEVKLGNSFKKSETEIASSPVNAIKWNILVQQY